MNPARSRKGGWILSATTAASLLCGAAAWAIATDRQAEPLFFDLGHMPPAAPAVAAVAEAAPEVADEAPPAPDDPAPPEAAPDMPEPDTAPTVATAEAVALPEVERSVATDMALPPPPEKPVEKRRIEAEPKPESKPERKPEKKKEDQEKAGKETAKTAADKPEETAKADDKPKDAKKEKAASSASASAPKAGSKTKGGAAVSPAAYAKAVMKKVRSTKKKSGAGKGTVVVGFTIAADGSLAGVKLLQGSGNAALDKIALDHIRRSVPFPAPPEGAGRSYSFEFVGK